MTLFHVVEYDTVTSTVLSDTAYTLSTKHSKKMTFQFLPDKPNGMFTITAMCFPSLDECTFSEGKELTFPQNHTCSLSIPVEKVNLVMSVIHQLQYTHFVLTEVKPTRDDLLRVGVRYPKHLKRLIVRVPARTRSVLTFRENAV